MKWRLSRREVDTNLESTDSIINSIDIASDKFEHTNEFDNSYSVGSAREMEKGLGAYFLV